MLNKQKRIKYLHRLLKKAIGQDEDSIFWNDAFSDKSPEEIDEQLRILIDHLKDIIYNISFTVTPGSNLENEVMGYVDYLLQYMKPSKRAEWRKPFEDDIKYINMVLTDKDATKEQLSHVNSKISDFIALMMRVLVQIAEDLYRHKPKSKADIEREEQVFQKRKLENANKILEKKKQKELDMAEEEERERRKAIERAKFFKR